MGRNRGFKGRQFTAAVILWAVRWYLMFPISYRDLELMLLDRGVEVDHSTIFRWIQAYAAELEKQIRLLRDNQGENRIASPEMLPCADPLPHLICSPPIIIGGDRHGADQHGDTGRVGGCIGGTLPVEQP